MDEIEGEEAFADTPGAMEAEIETFHALCGLSIRHLCDARAASACRLRILAVGIRRGSTGWSASAA